MNAERWQRVKEVLHGAMQLAPEERGRFLDAACGFDDSLRAEVQSLLLAEENVRSTFLQSAPAGVTDTLWPIPAQPARLGPYEILGLIARGGMGEVYRAQDTRLRRYVAVKILPANLGRDPARQKRFEREARAASALNHPNIVSVYDIGREGDIPFIVSEFVEGESLRSRIARGPLPIAQIVDIGMQLAAGLTAAHAAGIVHRDIKPENIMLTPDRRVKILDFGLAKQMEQHVDAARRIQTLPITAPGVVMGTLGYLSPEQVRGETVDTRSDIFSFGAVLYEMAVGKPAFTRGKVMDVMGAILREEPAALGPDIPPALDHIIRQCLEKDAQRRFQSASSLAAALQDVGNTPALRKWIMWAAAAIVGICGGWFVAHSLPWREPAPVKQVQLAVVQPSVPTPVPAPTPAPEPQKVDTPPVPRTAVIETIAGHPWKFTGDGMPALQAPLGHCDDMKCDREGNIYVSDWGNQIIAKIDRGGILHVLARASNPIGLVLAGSGTLYFSQGPSIAKLLPDGQVTPFAGGAFNEVSGMVLAADRSLIFAEHGNQRIRRIDLQGRLGTVAGDGKRRFAGDNGPATQASLAGPRGLALDRAGNLFIADQDNHCVRRVSPDGRITTVAGQGVAGELGCPSGVAVNSRGELYVADPCKRRIFMLRDGGLLRIGGTGADHQEPPGDGGSALAATFNGWKLALDEKENLLISAPDLGHIYRISREGRFNIIAGSGFWGVTRDGTPARQALFQDLFRVAVDRHGNIFMTDLPANRIYRLDRKGMVSQVAGYAGSGYDGEDTQARNYRLNGPHGIRVSPTGSIVFADCFNNRVREVTADGRLRTLAGNGMRQYTGDGGRAVDAALNYPAGVGIDKSGNVYIADTGNHRIRKITADGRIVTIAGNGTPGYSGDGGSAEQASLKGPRAVEVDSNGDLYIADMGNHRIRRVSAGVISTLAGASEAGFSGDGGYSANARLNLPGDLALSTDHRLYILDRPTRRIRQIDLASGIITTFAGNGESVASGDGGPPTQAGLGDPAGIAVDAAGNVYVTDRDSKQLRVIRPAPH